MAKKNKLTKKRKIKRELNSQRTENKNMRNENAILLEKVNSTLADRSESAKIIDDYLRYRKMVVNLAGDLLRLTMGMDNWTRNRLEEAKELLNEEIAGKFADKFDDMNFIVKEQLNLFNKIVPEANDPYEIQEHDIDEAVDDSGNLFIKDVVSPGYKFEDIVIKKAKVTVYKKRR